MVLVVSIGFNSTPPPARLNSTCYQYKKVTKPANNPLAALAVLRYLAANLVSVSQEFAGLDLAGLWKIIMPISYCKK